MNTKKEALTILNLPPGATRNDMESAYSRLVKRYPPEFHPDKFRQIDEAYRFLTSLPYMLEKLLSPEKKDAQLDQEIFSFTLSLSSSAVEDALWEIKKHCRVAYLWTSFTKN
jgi:curved DNA-binding protein CbpA